MSFLDRIRRCSPPPGLDRFLTFRVEGRPYGLIAPSFAQLLSAFPAVFRIEDGAVDLDPGLRTPAERTRQVNGVLRLLAGQGEIEAWRDELFPVTEGFREPAVFNIDRSAVTAFGVRAFGVHVNGFVRAPDGLKMWIGVRAADTRIEPGKFDQMVAGGQAAGLGLMENVIKESGEEAAIPPDVAARAVPAGATSYVMAWGEGVKRDTLFNFDLELPIDFQPRNADGEMQRFELWPVEHVIDRVRDSDDFKFNCSLVAIDFLIRHGHIAPDHPDYHEILCGLHQPLDIGRRSAVQAGV